MRMDLMKLEEESWGGIRFDDYGTHFESSGMSYDLFSGNLRLGAFDSVCYLQDRKGGV